VDPSGHDFLDSFVRFLFGPIFGGLILGDSPETILKGVAINAISAGLFHGAGDIVAQIAAVAEAGAISAQAVSIAAAGVHAAAGAASGAIGAAITGGDVGLGALSGAISGGVSEYAGGYLPEGFEYQLAGHSVIGGLAGGITAELYGGDFGEGFGQGASIAASGFLFNRMMHSGKEDVDPDPVSSKLRAWEAKGRILDADAMKLAEAFGAGGAVGGAALKAGVQVFAKGGQAWHLGLEYGNKLNIAHIGNHPRFGFHAAFGNVGPKFANWHIYFQKSFPFFRFWKP
jgi:hypothetical protein